MQKFLHIICSFWLSCLLLFGTAPKEFLHEFARHQDTMHRHDVKGPTAEAVHHHCSFIGFHLMPFAAPPVMPLVLRMQLPEHVAYVAVQDIRSMQQVIALREGRGPPCFS